MTQAAPTSNDTAQRSWEISPVGAVHFGITQVVDGNWGVHAIIRKEVFAGRA